MTASAIRSILGKQLAYLATPYTKYPTSLGGIEGAFIEAARIAASLLQSGVNVYSPIVHMHPLAIHGGIDPLDHAIWLPANQAMMDACQILIVATMTSWESSYGISHEIDWYRKQGRKIFWLDPVAMKMTSEYVRLVAENGIDLAHNKIPSEHAGPSA